MKKQLLPALLVLTTISSVFYSCNKQSTNSIAGQYDVCTNSQPNGDGVCDIELLSDGTYYNYNYTYPTNGEYEEGEWKVENDYLYMRMWQEQWESTSTGETFVGWDFGDWEDAILEVYNDHLILEGNTKWIKL